MAGAVAITASSPPRTRPWWAARLPSILRMRRGRTKSFPAFPWFLPARTSLWR